MPAPDPSFTQSKWLAFFAELTAKLTHHNVFVAIEGCEILRRLLISHISIAAFLQEGELLQSLLHTFVGGVRSERPPAGVSTALSEELSVVQLETLSLCVEMMVAMHTDADAYDSLLVLARAGAIVEGLLEVLPRPQPALFGPVTSVLCALLALPLGHDASPAAMKELASTPSVALQRHVSELAGLVRGHGRLLQDAVDTLTAVAATRSGAQRCAALRLLSMANRRLRRCRLQHRGGADDETSLARESHRGGLNRSYADPSEGLATVGATTDAASTTALSDFNATITGVTLVEGRMGLNREEGEGSPARGWSSTPVTEATETGTGAARDRRASQSTMDAAREDASVMLEGEPLEGSFAVPVEVVGAALDAVAVCTSHESFFAALSDLWAVTVADPALLVARLDRRAVDSLSRFLLVAPATRQDRALFTALLRWLGHVLMCHPLPPPTRAALAEVAAGYLIPMLQTELAAREGRGVGGGDASAPARDRWTASASTFTTVATTTTAITTPTTSTTTVPTGAMVEVPSTCLALFSFLLAAAPACSPRQAVDWVQAGRLLDLLERAVQHIAHVRSAMIDTPTNADGALSDEVYLDNALRMVRTDEVTVAVLSCKLLSSLLWAHAAVMRERLTAEMRALVRSMVPLLMRVVTQNPTVTSSRPGAAVTSALYYAPGSSGAVGSIHSGPPEEAEGGGSDHRSSSRASGGGGASRGAGSLRWTRYTTLGECAAVALDGLLAFHKFTGLQCVGVAEVMPALPGLARSTRASIHAPLRGCVHRVLTYLCTSPAHVVEVAGEVPSVMNAAVTSVLAHDRTTPPWEAAAAAEWLCTVLRVTAADPRVDARFNLGRSALPLRLLDVAAQAPVSSATVGLLELLVALSEQQERLAESEAEAGVVEALAPHGRRSLALWTRLAQRATGANERLARLSRGAAGLRGTAPAAQGTLPRALTALEQITVQYAFTAAVFRGLVRLLHLFPEHRSGLSHMTVYALLGGALAVPTPAHVCAMLSARFATAVGPHPTLTRAHGALVQWACELAPVWFTLPERGEGGHHCGGGRAYPPLPTSTLVDAARIMADETLPPRTRCHLPLLLSSLLVLPGPVSDVGLAGTALAGGEERAESVGDGAGGSALRASIAPVAGRLFDASCALKRLTCVSGLQCRLVASFYEANAAAHVSGWFTQRVNDLAVLTDQLLRSSGTLDAADTESFLVTLSLVTSVVAYPGCRSLPRDTRQSLCASLAEGVRFPHTRLPTLRALHALSGSSEGHHCLLHEIATSGEPLARSCFGRLLGVALGLPSVWDVQRRSGGVANTAGAEEWGRGGLYEGLQGGSGSSSSQWAARQQVQGGLALDAVTAACGRGGHPFAAAVRRHRGLDALERQLRSEGGRDSARVGAAALSTAPPSPSPSPADGERLLGLLRLTAALSFDGDTLRALFHSPELVTVLVEWAACVDTVGTLALLVLRNACLHPTLKTVVCQDVRVLLTVKAALLGLSSVEPLVVDPALAESTHGRRGAPGRASVVMRRDIAESGSAALTDWATHAARRCIRARMRAMSPPPAHSSSPRAKPAPSCLLSPPPPPPSPPRQVRSETDAGAATGPHRASRQTLALQALRALAHDNERGKQHLRQVLRQEPGVDLDRLRDGGGYSSEQKEERDVVNGLDEGGWGDPTCASAGGRRAWGVHDRGEGARPDRASSTRVHDRSPFLPSDPLARGVGALQELAEDARPLRVHPVA